MRGHNNMKNFFDGLVNFVIMTFLCLLTFVGFITIEDEEEQNELKNKKFWEDCENYKKEHGVYPPKVQSFFDCINNYGKKVIQANGELADYREHEMKKEIYKEYKATKDKKGLKEKLALKYRTWDHIVDEAIKTKGKGFDTNKLLKLQDS